MAKVTIDTVNSNTASNGNVQPVIAQHELDTTTLDRNTADTKATGHTRSNRRTEAGNNSGTGDSSNAVNCDQKRAEDCHDSVSSQPTNPQPTVGAETADNSIGNAKANAAELGTGPQNVVLLGEEIPDSDDDEKPQANPNERNKRTQPVAYANTNISRVEDSQDGAPLEISSAERGTTYALQWPPTDSWQKRRVDSENSSHSVQHETPAITASGLSAKTPKQAKTKGDSGKWSASRNENADTDQVDASTDVGSAVRMANKAHLTLGSLPMKPQRPSQKRGARVAFAESPSKDQPSLERVNKRPRNRKTKAPGSSRPVTSSKCRVTETAENPGNLTCDDEEPPGARQHKLAGAEASAAKTAEISIGDVEASAVQELQQVEATRHDLAQPDAVIPDSQDENLSDGSTTEENSPDLEAVYTARAYRLFNERKKVSFEAQSQDAQRGSRVFGEGIHRVPTATAEFPFVLAVKANGVKMERTSEGLWIFVEHGVDYNISERCDR